MKIKYLSSARDDMIWFRRYYDSVFPAGKNNARSRLKQVFSLLLEQPYIGHSLEDIADARELPIRQTPFSVVYRVRDDHIEVVRVLDQRALR